MEAGAPLHAAIADAPPGGQAAWVAAGDGVRLRAAHWRPDGARRSVLIFPGRTEYIEKYGAVCGALTQAGCAALVVDWRGQGLSDRLLSDPLPGHVHRFADYQADVAALLAHARALRLPEPYHLLAHSMGGAIGLRAVIDGLPVASAAFSAPMWGIQLSGALRPAAWAMSQAARRVGLSHLYAPGSAGAAYPEAIPFEVNMLTGDAARYAQMAAQTRAVPELALGGPSLGWLAEALVECRRLAALPSPATPALSVIGTAEQIVDPAAVEARMRGWPNGRLVTIEGARHECLMETDERRARALAEIVELFTA